MRSKEIVINKEESKVSDRGVKVFKSVVRFIGFMKRRPEFFDHVFKTTSGMRIIESDNNIMREMSFKYKVGAGNGSRIERSAIGNDPDIYGGVKSPSVDKLKEIKSSIPVSFRREEESNNLLRSGIKGGIKIMMFTKNIDIGFVDNNSRRKIDFGSKEKFVEDRSGRILPVVDRLMRDIDIKESFKSDNDRSRGEVKINSEEKSGSEDMMREMNTGEGDRVGAVLDREFVPYEEESPSISGIMFKFMRACRVDTFIDHKKGTFFFPAQGKSTKRTEKRHIFLRSNFFSSFFNLSAAERAEKRISIGIDVLIRCAAIRAMKRLKDICAMFDRLNFDAGFLPSRYNLLPG
ncbi:MAG: hypothetical protein Q7J67_06960 [bacterium]|nr:hypothetical protein [bacterium]